MKIKSDTPNETKVSSAYVEDILWSFGNKYNLLDIIEILVSK